MATDTPLNALLEWCCTIPLDETQISVINYIRWKSGLDECIAALAPGTINTPDANGITALSHLASTAPPGDELKFVLANGIEQMLAAGANPLAGRRPAALRGPFFTEDPRTQKMLSALISAQRDGSSYKTESGGNLLHAMTNTEIDLFSRLAQDRIVVLLNARDVVSAWRSEVDAQGRTPVDLAWERYPVSPRDEVETRNEAASTWSLLLQGPKGIWQPPPMDMQCADGQLLYQRVLSKVDQGMPVPPQAQDLVEQLRAMALRDHLDKGTPEISGIVPPRTPRL